MGLVGAGGRCCPRPSPNISLPTACQGKLRRCIATNACHSEHDSLVADPAVSRRVLLTGSLTAGLIQQPGPANAEVATISVAADPALLDAPSPVAAEPVITMEPIHAFRDPYINQGLATSSSIRESSRLQGLLPGGTVELDVELLRARTAVTRAATPLDKYQVLMTLRETNATCFYSVLQEDLEDLLPILYTPTVGDACLAWGSLIPRPTGLYINYAQHAGRVRQVVDTWPYDQVRIAVITDGERILGLGDLGAHGMGIPVGKSVVYGGCGVDARQVLPVCVDVGCAREVIRSDPLYVGLRQPRIPDAAYYTFMNEVVAAIQARYGSRVVIHWEDVGVRHSFQLLSQLTSRGVPTFNDDIQCTAAITLAALLSAQTLPGVLPLNQQRVLFFGAGQANLGCARLLAAALQQGTGLTEEEVKSNIWLMDSKGLVLNNRTDLSPEKAEFAADPSSLLTPSGSAPPQDLLSAVRAVRPTCLIGAASVPGAFTQQVIEALVMTTQQQADEQQEKQTRWTLDALGYPRQASASPTLQPVAPTYINYSSNALPDVNIQQPFSQQLYCQPMSSDGGLQGAVQAASGFGDVVAAGRFVAVGAESSDGWGSYEYPVGGGGVSGPGSDASSVIDGLAELRLVSDARPIVLALSNPTSQAECSYEQAYRWSQGRVVFASGTRFPSLQVDPTTRQPVPATTSTSTQSSSPSSPSSLRSSASPRMLRPLSPPRANMSSTNNNNNSSANTTLTPAQCNNCYVFPGIGLGAMVSGATRVTEGMLLAAARAVAAAVPDAQLHANENILPPISQLRAVTAAVAAAVASGAVVDKVATPAGALLAAGHKFGVGQQPCVVVEGQQQPGGVSGAQGRSGQVLGGGQVLSDVQACLQTLMYTARNDAGKQ